MRVWQRVARVHRRQLMVAINAQTQIISICCTTCCTVSLAQVVGLLVYDKSINLQHLDMLNIRAAAAEKLEGTYSVMWTPIRFLPPILSLSPVVAPPMFHPFPSISSFLFLNLAEICKLSTVLSVK